MQTFLMDHQNKRPNVHYWWPICIIPCSNVLVCTNLSNKKLMIFLWFFFLWFCALFSEALFVHVCRFYSFCWSFSIEISGIYWRIFVSDFLFIFLYIFFVGRLQVMQVIYLYICISLLTRCDIFTNVRNKWWMIGEISDVWCGFRVVLRTVVKDYVI